VLPQVAGVAEAVLLLAGHGVVLSPRRGPRGPQGCAFQSGTETAVTGK
jgi:hypothetical protein